LLGLVSFSAAQKTKEIGIRKVLGATAASIVLLITKDFTRLVLLAIVVGIPLAYWVMSQWLNDFAYKTDIGIWTIVTLGGDVSRHRLWHGSFPGDQGRAHQPGGYLEKRIAMKFMLVKNTSGIPIRCSSPYFFYSTFITILTTIGKIIINGPRRPSIR